MAAAALECWSGRPSTDEDTVEQSLMKTNDRSEVFLPPQNSSSSNSNSTTSSPTRIPPPKKWQRIGRNFAGAIASLKNSLNIDNNNNSSSSPQKLDKLHWGGVVRNLTQLYPGSQLPEKLISDIRRHFDSLPTTYVQAGYDMKEVLLHARLIEQAAAEEQPQVHVQPMPGDCNEEVEGGNNVYKLVFVSCNSALSWGAVSGALDMSATCCKKIQVFEKKGLTLGVVMVIVQGCGERQFRGRMEAVVRSAVKKPRNGGVKLPFGLCGCQEEASKNVEEEGVLDGEEQVQLQSPLQESSVVVSVDEWQMVRSGCEDIAKWMLNSDEVEFVEQIGLHSFKGIYKGKKVWVKKLKGCERGTAYDIEIRQDLLQLMSCGQRNLLQFCGICVEESHGMCVVMRLMEGGSVHDLLQRSKKMGGKEVMRIAGDVAEGLMFMNSHGVAYRDLNTQRILLDRQGNACLGDMGIVSSCYNVGEVTEYETAGFRWLAPEIIAGDPEIVTETWMSNVYSFGMVMWEMVTGDVAYSSLSPVQAAVGIAACGLRPDIPKDCPHVLRSLMMKCWNNCPSKRPHFSEIVAILQKQNNR